MSRRNSFYNIAKELEMAPENEGYLIIIRCGAFFTSIGDNAIVLSDELHLRLTCFKKGICKIGVPISSLYDFVKKLDSIGYSYVIYNYSKDEMVNNGRKYTECYRFRGKYVDKSMQILDCSECENYNKSYDNIDIFTEMKKLQEKKNLNNMENKIEQNNDEEKMGKVLSLFDDENNI